MILPDRRNLPIFILFGGVFSLEFLESNLETIINCISGAKVTFQ